jgi:D-alanyl-D-alanine dipeptidase
MTNAVDNVNLLDSRILRYRDLVSVPISDDGEPLVTITPVPELSIVLDDLELPLARQDAWRRLQEAARILKGKNKEYGLRVWYAYRSLGVQKHFFELQKEALKKQHPDMNEADLLDQVHMFVAVPDVAGHPTGGAFDLTVTRNGEKLDMGCEYPDFNSPVLHTFADGLTAEQKANRMLLREAMLGAGFCPFNGEWWHFSYGDREWAKFYGKKNGIYSQVEAPKELVDHAKERTTLPALK